MAMLGVIGGSGFYQLPELESDAAVEVETPFGLPSGPLRRGRIGGTEIAFLSRHGEGHRFSPSNLPYRANIYALKAAGVTHVLSVSAVGSLEAAMAPRSFVLPDQIIDRTHIRPRTFFDDGVVAHVGLADPFCPVWRARLGAAATEIAHSTVTDGTYVCIEGPQFSTRAESRLYRHWGGRVIGMTAMPEARLAREAELCYATLASVTDYDVWHESEQDVSVDVVVGHLRANVEAAARLLRAVCAAGLPERSCGCGDALRGAIMTAPRFVSAEQRQRLGLIADRYLSPNEDGVE